MIAELPPCVDASRSMHRTIQMHAVLTLRARYVFPVAGRPIPDGSVTIDGERIVAVGRAAQASRRGPRPGQRGHPARAGQRPRASRFQRFDRAAGRAGHRLRRLDSPGDGLSAAAPGSPSLTGATASEVAGGARPATRASAAASPRSARSPSPAGRSTTMAASPLNVTVFQELIAPTAERVAAALELAKSHLRSSVRRREQCDNWQPGLSPHAPYSVHPDLLAAVIATVGGRASPRGHAPGRIAGGVGIAAARHRPAAGSLGGTWGVGRHGDSGPALGRWTTCGFWRRPIARW